MIMVSTKKVVNYPACQVLKEEMSKCLNDETNLNCQHQRPNSTYVFTENDVEKQEVSQTKKKPFECDRCDKKVSSRSNLS